MRWLLFISFSVFQLIALGQSGTIRGFVYDKTSGEPVIFTNVFLKGTQIGASTDVNGYYSITKIPPGEYTISVSALGYGGGDEKISLGKGQILNQKLFIESKVEELGVVEISAEKIEAQSEVKMSVQKITPKEIEKLPSIGGEADIAQYMQVLPGVIFTGDQGGQLYIRGGSPVQNKVLLDGMIVYNPFHSIGLFSVFDTDIIRNADVYTGGFGANYGGRISSIMDITTIDGNHNEFHGNASLTTFGAKFNIEGPIVKPKTIGGSGISYIASAKHSYLNQSSKLVYSYIDEEGLPFQYTDLYGKITFNGENGSKANIFGLYFDDRVKYKAISDLNWNNAGVGGNFILIPGGSPVLIDGNFAYSAYNINLLENGVNADRRSSINGFNGGLNFTYFLGEDDVKYGLEVIGFSTDYKFTNEVNRVIEQQQSTTELAFYIRYKKKLGKLILDPSMRLHYYASLSTLSPEPRLGIKMNVTDNIRLKGAAGVYSQNLIAANSDRDVVNLFNGYLAGPDNLQEQLNLEDGSQRDITHALQKANHFILGTEIDITRKINLNVEGYYKVFTQVTNVNRNKIFDEDGNDDQPDELKKDFIIETGDAFGVDLVLKYDLKNINLYAVYSIGKVNRWDGIQAYSPVFDRRHNVNFVGSYEFGKTRLWEFNARWNMGSGFPFTQTLGFYEQYDFSNGTGTNLINSNGGIGIIYDDLNGGRLPYYHRLDLTLKREFVLSLNSILEANVGVTNAYNRANIFYFDRVNFERVNQLPLMPSAGVKISF
ncbi:TonB-dependent receptor [Salibacteraceae bacterium]|nr:TonB-dependent receptor [Flavobacteriales bacterium]MDB9701202.1 TonB-dependent receptor [Salibacteraceae bacterium]